MGDETLGRCRQCRNRLPAGEMRDHYLLYPPILSGDVVELCSPDCVSAYAGRLALRDIFEGRTL